MKKYYLYKLGNSPNYLTDKQISRILKYFDNHVYLYSTDVYMMLGISYSEYNVHNFSVLQAIKFVENIEDSLKSDLYDIISKGYHFEKTISGNGNFIFSFHFINESMCDCNYFLKVIDRLKKILDEYKFLKIEDSDYGKRAVFEKISS